MNDPNYRRMKKAGIGTTKFSFLEKFIFTQNTQKRNVCKIRFQTISQLIKLHKEILEHQKT